MRSSAVFSLDADRSVVQIGEFSFIIDRTHEHLCSLYSWHVIGAGRRKRYACGLIGRKKVLLHRFIVDAPSHMQVDHIDGNTLNNTLSNLRLATIQQNCVNRKISRTSRAGYRGVRETKPGSFCAQTKNRGAYIYLGSYRTPEAAARAYDAYMRQHHGEFANLNFAEVGQ